jgi:ionotropic glutamate receptor
MMHAGKNFTGNSRFYGFCVDVLESISKEVGFDYLLDLVPDRKYGARDPSTGQWNGMVRELIQHVRIFVQLFIGRSDCYCTC